MLGKFIILLAALVVTVAIGFSYKSTTKSAPVGNSFRVKTDKSKVEVSWQVTGIRKDKFAEEHRIQVELEKTASDRRSLQNP